MFHIEQLPFNDQEAKKLREWLNLPEARNFIRYLVHKDAEFSAEAANALIGQGEVDAGAEVVDNVKEAQVHAERARFFREVIKLIQDVKNPKFSLEMATVKPMMASEIQS